MTHEQQIKELSNIIFEHGQKMGEGDFKTSQDILKILFEKNKEQCFEDENKEYDVVFIKNGYRVTIPNTNPDCHPDCCGKTEIRIHPSTSRRVLKLHPMLVDYLNSELGVITGGIHDYDITTPYFSDYFFKKFLKKQDREDEQLLKFCVKQYTLTLLFAMRSMSNETNVGQEPKCGEECACSNFLSLNNHIILYKIRIHTC